MGGAWWPPGRYRAAILYSAARGPAALTFTIGGTPLALTLEGTGGWGQTRKTELGEILVEGEGALPVILKPVRHKHKPVNFWRLELRR